jgi:hypothetical protein
VQIWTKDEAGKVISRLKEANWQIWKFKQAPEDYQPKRLMKEDAAWT